MHSYCKDVIFAVAVQKVIKLVCKEKAKLYKKRSFFVRQAKRIAFAAKKQRVEVLQREFICKARYNRNKVLVQGENNVETKKTPASCG